MYSQVQVPIHESTSVQLLHGNIKIPTKEMVCHSSILNLFQYHQKSLYYTDTVLGVALVYISIDIRTTYPLSSTITSTYYIVIQLITYL